MDPGLRRDDGGAVVPARSHASPAPAARFTASLARYPAALLDFNPVSPQSSPPGHDPRPGGVSRVAGAFSALYQFNQIRPGAGGGATTLAFEPPVRPRSFGSRAVPPPRDFDLVVDLG